MNQPLKLVFAGTPSFAVPTLEALVESQFNISLVVTQPDRPRGRGMELAVSAVKQSAMKHGLPVAQPEKIKHNVEFQAQLTELHPDAIVVVGYGRIIPKWMIDLPRLGNVNVHASLLPKYRGAAPIQWAIAEGETLTGVTTMRIDEGLDTGDILLQREMAILPGDTAETLAPRLAALGAATMLETFQGLEAGSLPSHPQDHSRATLAPILKKEDGLIDFRRSALDIHNRLRGFSPWPGAFTSFRKKQLHVWAARPVDTEIPSAQLQANGSMLLVGCGSGTSLEIFELQVEGKKRMSVQDFVNGYRPYDGEVLGT